MATTIKLKNSVTTTNAPSSLVQGEVAINITDKKVWVGNAAGTPIQLLGAGGSASFGALTCTSLTNSGLTSGRVTYASTGGLLADSANFTFNGTTVTMANDASISGLTVGKGGGAVATATAVGYQALNSNTTGSRITAVGYQAGFANSTNSFSAYIGYRAGYNVTGDLNVAVGDRALEGASGSTATQTVAIGQGALVNVTSGNSMVAIGYSALASNTTGTYNVAVGQQALQANTTASNNTAVGYQAGYSNTTGGVTAFGYQAAYGNTTGQFVTAFGRYAAFSANATLGNDLCAIGDRAAYSTTTGVNNVAIGSLSLYSNTTGGNNSAFGTLALYSNTTASNNTAVGYQAGYSNTTGGAITAVGYQCLYSNTTGTDNHAFGDRALRSNTTGGVNSAFGYGTLFDNTTGSSNTAFGGLALRYNTTASNNTAVGYQALYTNTLAGKNTAIGYGALYTANRTADTDGNNTAVGSTAGYGLTTGKSNIFVGQASGQVITTGEGCIHIGVNVSASATTSNTEHIIGNSLTGKGNDTTFIQNACYQGNNTTTWSTTSDRRIKKNIVDNNDGLNKLSGIRVRNFEYRLPEEVDAELKPTDAVIKSGIQLGVIAQELQQVLPECVEQQSTGVLSVQTDSLIWYAINAIKELKAEVDSLKAKLNNGA